MLTPSGFIKLLVFNGEAMLKLKHLTLGIHVQKQIPFMECICLFYVDPAMITIAKEKKEIFKGQRTKKG